RLLRNGRRLWDDGSQAGTIASGGGADVAKNSHGRAEYYSDCFRNELPASNFRLVGDAADAHGGGLGRCARLVRWFTSSTLAIWDTHFWGRRGTTLGTLPTGAG